MPPRKRSAMRKVFLSSTARDLTPHRDSVAYCDWLTERMVVSEALWLRELAALARGTAMSPAAVRKKLLGS
jgi:hypothetical protein